MVLEGEGYEVVTWRTGERFLADADLGPEDVVILDLGLPGMQGDKVAAALTKRGDTPRTIIISGQRSRTFAKANASVTHVAALRKPLERDVLKAALRQLHDGDHPDGRAIGVST